MARTALELSRQEWESYRPGAVSEEAHRRKPSDAAIEREQEAWRGRVRHPGSLTYAQECEVLAGSGGLEVTLDRIVRVTVTEDTLSVDLEDGRTISERANSEISGAGLGIHWPDLA